MNHATERPQSPIESLARQTGFSPDAVAAMHRAVVAGGGGMAQFDHPEFGGAGQWMSGGMLMTSDPSDHALRARIAQLCEALARSTPSAEPDRTFQSQRQSSGLGSATMDGGTGWWPRSYGAPDTSGAQEGLRYAWFADARRLAIDEGGRVTVYDTGEHRIGGVAQQQGGGRSLAFTSQHGLIDLERLRVVEDRADGGPAASAAPLATAADTPVHPQRVAEPAPGPRDASPPVPRVRASPDPAAAARPASEGAAPSTATASSIDPFDALERLAALHARGIVDDAEYRTKKAELLARI